MYMFNLSMYIRCYIPMYALYKSKYIYMCGYIEGIQVYRVEVRYIQKELVYYSIY